MPLFGPNIKKMKEQGDIQGLVRELENKKYEVRIEIVQALKELKNVKGLVEALKNDMPGVRLAAAEALKETDHEGMAHAANFFIKMLKYWDDEAKIEALTRICGHGDYTFLFLWFGSEWKAKELEKVRSKFPVELVRTDLVDEIVNQKVHPVVRWYASVALIELGDRSDEILDELIKIGDELVTVYDREPEHGEDSFNIAGRTFLAYCIKEETLRALSHFKGNSVATNAIVSAMEGDFLSGRSKGEPSLDDKRIICAIGALGDPCTYERLEYLASYGDGEDRKRARIVLELFGRATYDEIKKLLTQKKLF